MTKSKEESLTQEQITERQKEEKGMPVKPFYPDDWEHSFGIPVDEHRNVSLDSVEQYQSFSDMSSEQGGGSVDG